MRPVRTVARTLLSGIFVVSGAQSAASPKSYAARAERVTDRVAPLLARANPRLPTDPTTLVRINGTVQLVGGLMLATGYFPRTAAAVLAGTLVPTTLAGHAYWAEDDPARRRMQRINLLKNLGLFGGLLLAAVDTEGRPGLRWRAEHAIVDSGRSVRRTVRDARRGTRIAARSARTARRLPG
ncbi:DoxX family protein [Micromonospora sp. NBC_01699]|uniref:DoxX family protein n=1 Tax=Micromonospora sp. NBC_01699 TaxID=2975984 RepID=UPI002E2E4E3A|nr:DoxX family protein [Micromonospora sp. NBC_01699]